MPKPKIPEEDKQEVVPLRLRKDVIAAVDRIADSWTERRGKEIKRATVARELVLIGLGAFEAIKDSSIFTEHAKKQRARQAQISLTTEEEDLISRFHRLPSESQGLIKQLIGTTKNAPQQSHFPDDEEFPEQFRAKNGEPAETIGPITPHRKGGRS